MEVKKNARSQKREFFLRFDIYAVYIDIITYKQKGRTASIRFSLVELSKGISLQTVDRLYSYIVISVPKNKKNPKENTKRELSFFFVVVVDSRKITHKPTGTFYSCQICDMKFTALPVYTHTHTHIQNTYTHYLYTQTMVQFMYLDKYTKILIKKKNNPWDLLCNPIHIHIQVLGTFIQRDGLRFRAPLDRHLCMKNQQLWCGFKNMSYFILPKNDIANMLLFTRKVMKKRKIDRQVLCKIQLSTTWSLIRFFLHLPTGIIAQLTQKDNFMSE